MEKVHLERLRKLADHLCCGNLGHKKFSFNDFNGFTEEDEINGVDYDENRCGTIGCALGECPIIFPNDWVFNRAFNPVSIDNKNNITALPIETAIKFFSINSDEAYHLFFPNLQFPKRHGGKILGIYATKEEVAANIYAFIHHKEKELGILPETDKTAKSW